jgi:dienelactone hydrolase
VIIERVAIDVTPGVTMESQSGLQNLRPRIYGALARPSGKSPTAAILMHPTSNYMGHYLLEPLAARGIACLALNSRYAGNDALLQMERVIADLGAAISHLRAQGFRRIYLIGNSGGASLASYYQAQAEYLTATEFVDGEPTRLAPSDIPPADGIVLSAAHLGRSILFCEWLDPSVVDENDADHVDSDWDLYDGATKPPFTPQFVQRFRAAQLRRRDRIEAWVQDRLAALRRTAHGPTDRMFLIHRTHADPRFLDLSIDTNDRKIGSVWGDPRTVNLAANAFGRLTSYRAFLSQLSSRSAARGAENLAATSVPVLLMIHTADQSTFPSTRDAWVAAGGKRLTSVDVPRGDHYLVRQPELVKFSADTIAAWMERQSR